MSCSPAHSRFQKQKEAYFRGDFKLVKKITDEARCELERKGLVNARPALGWIEKEWLNKALEEGVIVKRANDYIPVVKEHEEEVIMGYRGRMPIIEKKTKLDIAKWIDFCKRYEDFKNRKERQQYAINEEMRTLTGDEIKESHP